MKTSDVSGTGLTVLYEPEKRTPEVDIVFIHGLQGHPKKTWFWRSQKSVDQNISSDKPKRSLSLLRLPKLHKRGSKSIHADSITGPETPSDTPVEASTSTYQPSEQGTYWPVDLLPEECPNARILTWGYDSWVTKSYAATSKNNLFGHAKDFMYEYERNRPHGRGIIFVAHSLGGLIVKEVLRRCETSDETQFQNILQSTQAVIFLGTPHRGSPGFASIAEVVRSLGSTLLRFDSNESMIRALGIDAPELELSRESFISQWGRLQFTVKTFQEAQPLSGIGIGLLNKKVVPDISSTLDDPREHAESIPANHMDMCRYRDRTDPGYQKVGRELARLATRKNPASSYVPGFGSFFYSQELVIACKNALQFDGMSYRQNIIKSPLRNTCQWVFNHQAYMDWRGRHNVQTTHSMMWLKGIPGSGKSTIMKEIIRRIRLEATDAQLVISFYSNARGSALEHNTSGMLRSILLQLLSHSRVFEEVIVSHYENTNTKIWTLEPEELQQLTRQCLVDTEYRTRITICVDALDECGEHDAREIASFLREVTSDAFYAGRLLDVCISCRHYPNITLPNCPTIIMEQANKVDIVTFLEAKIPYGILADEETIDTLRSIILKKSQGVFLWVVLVVRMIIRDIDNGRSESEIQSGICDVPSDLEAVFNNLIESLPRNDLERFRNLIYWMILSLKKNSLEENEREQVLSTDGLSAADLDSIISNKPRTELRLLSDLEIAVDKDRSERLVRNLSRGLIEISSGRIQFIHETVREFILQNGHRIFGFADTDTLLMHGHLTIIRSCIHALMLHGCKPNDPSAPQTSRKGSCLNWISKYAAENLTEQAWIALKHDNFPLQMFYNVSWALQEHAIVMGFDPDPYEPEKVFLYPHTRCWFQLFPDLLHYCDTTISRLTVRDMGNSTETQAYRILRTWKYMEAGYVNKIRAVNWESLFYWAQNRLIRLIDQDHRESHEGYFQDNDGNTLLHLAASGGCDILAEYLISKGVPVDKRNSYGMTALHLACLFGRILAVGTLLKMGSSPTELSPEGYTALHITIERHGRVQRKFKITRLLLNFMSKEDVDLKNSYGQTALEQAVRYYFNLDEAIEAMIEKGADCNIVTGDGKVPYQIALGRGMKDIADLLKPHTHADFITEGEDSS
ncbi:hypothetical protein F4805DRAFT_434676 [Annulohypoxylon moriforme]|nr:hypothetical protein F4805DRAFT_434676 [Annulohypoxylon moriforme]